MLKLIVCLDQKNGIAKNNALAWNIKEEMEHFKKTTIHGIVVMGRKTYETIGKPLSKRDNIIFSRNKEFKVEGVLVTDDVLEVIEQSKLKDVFIIGGKEIYNLFLNYCDELIISKLNQDYNCDLFWEPNLESFELKNIEDHKVFSVHYYARLKEK